MAIDLAVVPYLVRTRELWDSSYEERATESQWKSVVAKMTDVQKKVHLAGRRDKLDQKDLADRLFRESRETYKQTLQDELNKWGCSGQKAVTPDKGRELSAIRERADWAAESIANTYNFELAKEIVRIGQDTPTANRNVYAYRLYYSKASWDGAYWKEKATQVSQIETMTTVNAATADFYARNGDRLAPTANIVPFQAVCPICQELVANNPYKTPDEAYNASVLPVHVGCVHRVEVVPPERLSQSECKSLWAGYG